MSNRLWAITALFIFLLLPASFAGEESEETFDLEKSVDIAVKNNYTIAQAKERIEQAHAKLNQAFSAFLPKIGADYMYTKLNKSEAFEFVPGMNVVVMEDSSHAMDINLQQPIFAGGRIVGSYMQAKDHLNVSKHDAQKVKQDLIHEVKKAYFAVLTAKKLVEVQGEAVSNIESHLNDVKNLYEVGIVPHVDMLRTQVELSHVKQSLIVAHNALNLAKAAFCNLLNFPLDKKFDLVDILEYKEPELDLKTCSDRALTQRPEILTQKAYIDSAKHGVWVARSGFFPEINLSAQRERNKGQTQPFEEWDYGSSAVISATMTLWDWANTYNKVKEEKSKMKEAQISLNLLSNNVLLEVKDSYLSQDTSLKRIEETKSAIELAQESYQLTQERYKEGVSTNTDVLDARTSLTQAEYDYYGSLYRYQTAKAALQRAMGE